MLVTLSRSVCDEVLTKVGIVGQGRGCDVVILPILYCILNLSMGHCIICEDATKDAPWEKKCGLMEVRMAVEKVRGHMLCAGLERVASNSLLSVKLGVTTWLSLGM